MPHMRCRNCALYLPQSNTCQIMIPALQQKIKPNDFCSHFKEQLYTCEICGAGLLDPIIEVKDGVVHIFCEKDRLGS